MDLGFLRDESRFSEAIRDPVWRHVWLTPELLEVTRAEPFLRLYRIKQLGPTEYVYPGATHTRASHSIGVYHVAHRILRVLLERGASSWVTKTGCDSFLAAALLHDLGHFPYTHSLKELPLESHEALTARIVLSSQMRDFVGRTGADPGMTAAIIDRTMTPTGIDAAELRFFRNILSGVLDPDKLDYLNRDAYYCGVPYGIQDTDFTLAHVFPNRERGIEIDERAIMSVESVLFSKYLMYRSVYWHRQVRIATAMMKKAVYAALARSLIVAEDLYATDDAGLYARIAALDYPEREIAPAIGSRAFFRTVAEYPFNPDDAASRELENLSNRTIAEGSIAAFLSRTTASRVLPHHVLVDIPERISFESDLRVRESGKAFSESATVFSPNVVRSFTDSLRMTRIAVHPSLAASLSGIDGLGAKLAKCIEVGYTKA